MVGPLDALHQLCLADAVWAERYEGWTELGRGGSASVVRTFSRATGEDIALKVFHHLAPEDEQRFRQEVRSAQRLTSPHIVRTYGAFPLILAEYVREEGRFTLPEAIRKMTSFPAQRIGLPDRGLLRDGFKADVVVFDARTVTAPATRREPKQFPVGIDYVVVNGRVVVEPGRHTGVLAGRALRRGRTST